MKVRATKMGHFKYLRDEGEVFHVPDDTVLTDGRGNPGWMERVPDDTPTTSKFGSTGQLRIDCSHCGLVVKGKFCSECGTPAEVSKSENDSEKKRADAVEAITGKRPPQKKAGRPRKEEKDEKPGEEI